MKKLLIIIALMMPVCVIAQQPAKKLTRQEKRYIKLANRLDILKCLPDTAIHQQGLFWKSVVEKNEDFNQMMEFFVEPTGLAKEALSKVKSAEGLNMFMNMSYDERKEGHQNKLLHGIMFGDSTAYKDITFRMNYDKDFNAFTTPDGYIYVNTGVLDKIDPDYDLMYGILAHEITHYLLKHQLIHEYMALKRERANKITAGIATIGVGIANMVGASYGGPVDTLTQKKTYEGIKAGAEEWTKAYRYRYGREEELTADIVAFRFLEWIGEDPNKYIEVLQKMEGGWLTRETDRYDDHPSPQDRIGVLKALTPAAWRVDSK